MRNSVTVRSLFASMAYKSRFMTLDFTVFFMSSLPVRFKHRRPKFDASQYVTKLSIDKALLSYVGTCMLNKGHGPESVYKHGTYRSFLTLDFTIFFLSSLPVRFKVEYRRRSKIDASQYAAKLSMDTKQTMHVFVYTMWTLVFSIETNALSY